MREFGKEYLNQAEQAAIKLVSEVVDIGKHSRSATLSWLSAEFERLLGTGEVRVGVIRNGGEKDEIRLAQDSDKESKRIVLGVLFHPERALKGMRGLADTEASLIASEFPEIMRETIDRHEYLKAWMN